MAPMALDPGRSRVNPFDQWRRRAVDDEEDGAVRIIGFGRVFRILSQMADNEEPMTVAASEIEEALNFRPTPKKDEPLKILPKLDVPDVDSVVNEKVTVEQTEPIHIPENLGVLHATILAAGAAEEEEIAEALKKINPEIVWRHTMYLLAPRGFVHESPRKDFSVGHTHNVKIFIAKCALSSLDEILSKEMDVSFLRRLLDDILDVLEFGTEGAAVPPQLNSPSSSGDPTLECLAAAPPCDGRASAELLAPRLEFL